MPATPTPSASFSPSPSHRPIFIEPLEPRQLLANVIPNLPDTEHLTKNDVTKILAAAASQAEDTQIITVVDRDGQILGVFQMKNARLGPVRDNLGNADDPLLRTMSKALSRARTAAFFQSHEDAFTTRTARFIIQDHFPVNLPNTGGGPLYGVEFSSLPGSDVYSGPAISGDPGGYPLFKNGVPVGGIGVAGDGSDRRVREGVPYDKATLPDPKQPPEAPINLYDGSEENDVDEQVALAGASGFPTPKEIQATRIFVGGLRFPFAADQPATGKPNRTLDQIIASGDGVLTMATAHNTGLPNFVDLPDGKGGTVKTGVGVIGSTAKGNGPYSDQPSSAVRSSPGSPYPAFTIGGIVGELKNTNTATVKGNEFGFQSGTVHKGEHLTVKNVKQIISQGVMQALKTRAGIRRPIGVPVRVHVTVVDTTGKILGAFRMQDGTNFSFDVAVQKARTANFFSDNKHAFSARAMGFLSQMFFPTGIDGGLEGPLFHIQNVLSLGGTFGIENRAEFTTTAPTTTNPLRNGITIFPGGAPLYKNGILVGAVGVSGDGVDQDDLTTFAATKHFQAKDAIRSDHLPEPKITSFLSAKVTQMESLFALDAFPGEDVAKESQDKLLLGLDDVQLPFQKFPRNPEI